MKHKTLQIPHLALRALCIGLFFLGLPGRGRIVRADVDSKVPASPAVAPIPDYVVQPDDTLDISVIGEPDLTRSLTVSEDGKITFPYAGQLTVSGLTIPQIEKSIRARIAVQLVDPQVSVSLAKRRELFVSIMGAVKTPGKVALQPNWRLLDLLAQSGGLTTLRPEWASATLVSGNHASPVNLLNLLTFATVTDNVLLTPGDILIVRPIDEARTQVQVLGEVVRPGIVSLPSDGAIAAALAAVGGPTPQAALSRATILRGKSSIPVNLQRLMTEGKLEDPVLLEPGDTLLLPTNKRQFAVFGAVTKPGAIAYPEAQQLDVLTALALAGGQNATADLKNVVLVHPSVTGGKPEITEVNLWKAMTKGDLSQSVFVMPGDILFLPDKGTNRHFQATDFVGLVSPLLYLAR